MYFTVLTLADGCWLSHRLIILIILIRHIAVVDCDKPEGQAPSVNIRQLLFVGLDLYFSVFLSTDG